ncbi:MAG: hypothetical protein AB8B55_20720 [Mariniblastus sp.]
MQRMYMQLKDLDLEKFERFGEVLSIEQIQSAKELLGSPVEWHKLLSKPESFAQRIAEAQVMDPTSYAIRLPKNGSITHDDVRGLKSESDFKALGTKHLDLVVFMIGL